MTPISLIQRATQFYDRTAIISADARLTYTELLESSSRFASLFLDGDDDLREARVAFLVPPGFEYVAVQWGIWQAGGIAVPLSPLHPPAEWRYVLDDADVSAVVVAAEHRQSIEQAVGNRSIRVLTTDIPATIRAAELPSIASTRRAMILYTSGTTSKPKGVVATHANIQAQVETLIDAWEWTAADHILHMLPLHHVHGIINALTCALWAGATCEFLPRFDPAAIWNRFARGDITLFMGVPTMYARLIAEYERASPEQQRAMTAGCQRMRLMVSGSAALPVSVLEKWHAISGHVLLERYGMTEIGMALSNPLHGPRVPGHVGTPLPGIEVRLVDETGELVPAETPGEIEVRGPTVFREYWRRPDATKAAFRDGWFRTGDMAVVENGVYRILGRTSVDIIKSGGYKISALEIEEVLRTHPAIRDCAVVGIPDDEWGERVSCCAVLQANNETTLDALRTWAKDRLAAYKIPKQLVIVPDLPRNAMGKVTKPEIVSLIQSSQ